MVSSIDIKFIKIHFRNMLNLLLLIVANFILIIYGLVLITSKFLFYTWDKLMIVTDRKSIIMDRNNKEPYLVRYYILFKDRNQNIPFNIFIHKFMKGDDDELHNHPWGYFTYILSGGYYERVLYNDGKQINHWRKPGFFQKVDHTHVHTITLNDNSKDSCWTLFIPFKRKNEWGFFKKNDERYEFIDSKTYLFEKSKKN